MGGVFVCAGTKSPTTKDGWIIISTHTTKNNFNLAESIASQSKHALMSNTNDCIISENFCATSFHLGKGIARYEYQIAYLCVYQSGAWSSSLYKFADKKNREDVIALRWPKACMSCGVDVPQTSDSRHGIIGLFHVDKKTTRKDKRHTQVLLKLPGFFYMCDECTSLIDATVKRLPKKLEKLVVTLQESPWMEFIEVEKSGHVRLPDGLFMEKLQDANPDACLKIKESPMTRLKRVMEVSE